MQNSKSTICGSLNPFEIYELDEITGKTVFRGALWPINAFRRGPPKDKIISRDCTFKNKSLGRRKQFLIKLIPFSASASIIAFNQTN